MLSMAQQISALPASWSPNGGGSCRQRWCGRSARLRRGRGDAAIVLPDGAIEGSVGGQCAEESVRVAALDALELGDTVLLRILPDGSETFPDTPGAVTVVNPCLSGGAIEVFLDPKLPAARIAVVGTTPIAEALVQFGTPLGFSVDHDAETVDDATAVIIEAMAAARSRRSVRRSTPESDSSGSWRAGPVGLPSSSRSS